MATQRPDAEVVDQKAIALKIKGLIGHGAWRVLTRPVAWGLKMMPKGMLYKAGLAARRGKYPYSTIQPGDTVVQVGAPHDLLKIGRSRAAFYAMLVGPTGRLFIFEPEPVSAAAMQDHIRNVGLDDRVTVIAKGCWSSERVLRFWSNPDHPASNLLEDVSEWDEAELRARHYQPSEVPVTTIDSVLAEAGPVRLVSVTTNGSEEEILTGGRETLARTEYLALAETGPEVEALSQKFGFRNVALDDRGFTSRRVAD